ncbi:unnamed protein product [Amoebophrya sp. A120]|nr:unnamed protein product [Amoebophrya sp. A120]|eukprot:GSA120T00007833001.1
MMAPSTATPDTVRMSASITFPCSEGRAVEEDPVVEKIKAKWNCPRLSDRVKFRLDWGMTGDEQDKILFTHKELLHLGLLWSDLDRDILLYEATDPAEEEEKKKKKKKQNYKLDRQKMQNDKNLANDGTGTSKRENANDSITLEMNETTSDSDEEVEESDPLTRLIVTYEDFSGAFLAKCWKKRFGDAVPYRNELPDMTFLSIMAFRPTAEDYTTNNKTKSLTSHASEDTCWLRLSDELNGKILETDDDITNRIMQILDDFFQTENADKLFQETKTPGVPTGGVREPEQGPHPPHGDSKNGSSVKNGSQNPLDIIEVETHLRLILTLPDFAIGDMLLRRPMHSCETESDLRKMFGLFECVLENFPQQAETEKDHPLVAEVLFRFAQRDWKVAAEVDKRTKWMIKTGAERPAEQLPLAAYPDFVEKGLMQLLRHGFSAASVRTPAGAYHELVGPAPFGFPPARAVKSAELFSALLGMKDLHALAVEKNREVKADGDVDNFTSFDLKAAADVFLERPDLAEAARIYLCPVEMRKEPKSFYKLKTWSEERERFEKLYRAPNHKKWAEIMRLAPPRPTSTSTLPSAGRTGAGATTTGPPVQPHMCEFSPLPNGGK